MLHYALRLLMRIGLVMTCLAVWGCSSTGGQDGHTSAEGPEEPPPPPAPSLPNIVLILTDDQRWDTLWAMPIVQAQLLAQGVTFTNAYATTPLCCPFRASLLAGGLYAQHTGVLSNVPPNGGVTAFRDTVTLAVRLQQAGYTTALIGKYLNRYTRIAPYVPPGWTQFVATASHNSWRVFRVTMGSSAAASTRGQLRAIQQYITDFQKDTALRFIEAHGDTPFFLYFSPHAPHDPAIPAPQDAALFSTFVYRERAYQEQDLSDKPPWVRLSAAPFAPQFRSIAEEDEFHRQQLRSLQAVDRAVGELVEAVARKGVLSRTVFILTSDNGFMWGEHGLFGKGKAYEEAIRVPLVIRMPGLAARQEEHLVASNLDLGATVLELAGITQPTDGMSLLPLLRAPKTAWREELLIENFAGPLWAGLRIKQPDADWKYVEYPSGAIELYDLRQDPYELASQHGNPQYEAKHQELAARLATLKGLASTVHSVPSGQVGQPYAFQLTAWGGQLPYAWDIVQGHLPQGLTLDSATGLIAGTPGRAESRPLVFRVQDASVNFYTQAPQAFLFSTVLVIAAP